jgi:hypothetical protein
MEDKRFIRFSSPDKEIQAEIPTRKDPNTYLAQTDFSNTIRVTQVARSNN